MKPSITKMRFLVIMTLFSLCTITLSAKSYSVQNTSKKNCLNDSIPPVITLNGKDTMCVPLQSVWTDPGATAVDSCDGDVTSSMIVTPGVDTRFLGIYPLLYIASDSRGNKDTMIRVVIVRDLYPPLINYAGTDTIRIEVETDFDPYTFTATDFNGNDITDSVNVSHNVNSDKLGSYEVKYSVSTPPNSCDYSATTQLTRVVIVEDRTPPIISAKNSAFVILDLNDTFTLKDHIIISDNHCTQEFLWDSLTIKFNDLNTSERGLYNMLVSTKDSANNESNTYSLLIQVKDLASVNLIDQSHTQVYPNPTTQGISIHSDFLINWINVYNIQGELLEELQVPTSYKQSLSFEHSAGLYILEVRTSNGLISRHRLIKQ